MPDYMKTNNKNREDKSQTGRSYSNKLANAGDT